MDKKNIVFSMLFRVLEYWHSDNGKNDIIIIKGDSDEWILYVRNSKWSLWGDKINGWR